MRWQIGQTSSFPTVGRTLRVRGEHFVLPAYLVCLVLCTAAPTHGQSEQPSHVQLPPAFGGTPLSYQIQAEASYVAAYGDMMESVATARKINAGAVAAEIQNSVDYVQAYFKRREINREARAKEDPNYLERETRRQKVLKRRVEEQYQDVLRGDVTKTLNWLLRELSGPVVAYRYLPADQGLAHSSLDPKLTDRDLQLIRLTDGGSQASRLVFAAADGRILQTPWPLGLRSPECAAARENYERTRDAVVKELEAKRQPSSEDQTQLMQDVNALFVALDDVYPKERRRDTNEFLTYWTAKRFLQSTLAGSHRAITTTDPQVFGGGLRFQGDSVVGLIEHMYQSGLEFAPPAQGGEGVYKTLFQGLRTLYTKISSEQPLAGPAGLPAHGGKERTESN